MREALCRVGQKHQEHGQSHDRAALKAAAGGQVAVEEDVSTEEQDDGDEHPRAGREQFARGQEAGAGAAFRRFRMRQNQPDDGGGQEQNRHLAQRIKAAIGDDDRRHHVLRAGLLNRLAGVITGGTVQGLVRRVSCEQRVED